MRDQCISILNWWPHLSIYDVDGDEVDDFDDDDDDDDHGGDDHDDHGGDDHDDDGGDVDDGDEDDDDGGDDDHLVITYSPSHSLLPHNIWKSQTVLSKWSQWWH